jgi:hypothetical protein
LVLKLNNENNSSGETIEEIKTQEMVINQSVNLDKGLEDVEGFVLPADPENEGQLEGEVEPPQDDEFICVNCFLVRHISQLGKTTRRGKICIECLKAGVTK